MPAVGPQLVPIALVPGQVGSLSSEQSQVPDRLSFVQNSAQTKFRLSSAQVQLRQNPDSAPLRFILSSGVESAQVQIQIKFRNSFALVKRRFRFKSS